MDKSLNQPNILYFINPLNNEWYCSIEKNSTTLKQNEITKQITIQTENKDKSLLIEARNS
jgi:hypothetical protein